MTAESVVADQQQTRPATADYIAYDDSIKSCVFMHRYDCSRDEQACECKLCTAHIYSLARPSSRYYVPIVGNVMSIMLITFFVYVHVVRKFEWPTLCNSTSCQRTHQVPDTGLDVHSAPYASANHLHI